jgi:hypothetical protein
MARSIECDDPVALGQRTDQAGVKIKQTGAGTVDQDDRPSRRPPGRAGRFTRVGVMQPNAVDHRKLPDGREAGLQAMALDLREGTEARDGEEGKKKPGHG